MNIDSTHLRVLVLGAPGTGKSALVNRFVDGTFSEVKLDILGWHRVKEIKIGQQTVKLQIWSLGKDAKLQYYKGMFKLMHCLILIFSSSEQGSIERAEEAFSSFHKNGPPDASIFLVETKTDLNLNSSSSQQLGAQLMQRLSTKRHVVRLSRCSAKTGDGVEKLFQQVATEAYESYLLSMEGKLVRPPKQDREGACSIL